MIALITVLIAHLSWRGWLAGMNGVMRGQLLRARRAVDRARARAARRRTGDGAADRRAAQPAARIPRANARAAAATAPSGRRKSCKALLQQDLAGDEVLVVSNREPYIHVRRNERHRGPAPGQRPGHRARAGDARLLGHLDRARRRAAPTARPSTRTTACRCRRRIRPTACAASG